MKKLIILTAIFCSPVLTMAEPLKCQSLIDKFVSENGHGTFDHPKFNKTPSAGNEVYAFTANDKETFKVLRNTIFVSPYGRSTRQTGISKLSVAYYDQDNANGLKETGQTQKEQTGDAEIYYDINTCKIIKFSCIHGNYSPNVDTGVMAKASHCQAYYQDHNTVFQVTDGYPNKEDVCVLKARSFCNNYKAFMPEAATNKQPNDEVKPDSVIGK